MKVLLNCIMLCLPLLAATQSNHRITGKIINPENHPIEGAVIRFIQNKKTAVTDKDGKFTMDNIVLSDTIKIYFINYQTITRFVSNSNEEINLTLIPVQKELEEVIVNNGYQRIPKERSPGSYTFVSNKELNLQTGGSTIARLNGITNGVMFDQSISRPAITIRGVSSIFGNKNPLIIVDNFPYEGDINNINPDDVESITLLKDASAASIWGARAGNGVIVINLKKGSYSKPLTISFNSSFSYSPKPDLSYLPLISSADFIDVEHMLYSKGYYTSTLSNISKPAVSPVVELLLKKTSGQLTAQEVDSRINALRTQSIINDYQKYMYQSKLLNRYALAFDGGSQTATYHISGGIDKSISELSAQFTKVNLYAENSFRPTNNLQINTSLYYTQSQSQSGKPFYGANSFNGQQFPVYSRLVDENGAPASINSLREPYTDTAGGGKLLDWKFYPTDDYLHNYTTTGKQDIVAAMSIQYQILKGLTLYAKYQYERQQTNAVTTQDINSFTTRDLINRYTQINRTTGIVKYIVPYGDILSTANGILASQNIRGQLSYNKGWGQHDISLLAGAEIREIENNIYNNRYYGYNDDISAVANVDLVTSYPNFVNGSNQPVPNGNSISGTLNRYVSHYFNGAYTFRKTYTLSVSARKDASNLFGADPNEKGVPLYSAGALWQLSKEPFYKLSWLPSLKIRMSYGSSGNVDNTKSAVTTISYSSVTAQFTNLPIANIAQVANPELRWEKIYMFNAGIDFSLQSVLSGSIEYYHKKGVDLFGTTPIDYTVGIGSRSLTRNVANISGNGIDLQLNARYPISRVFTWDQSFILNYAKTIISQYNQSATLGSAFISNGEAPLPQVGKPVYGISSYRWAGLDPNTGDPIGYVNGQPNKDYASITGTGTTANDLVYSGTTVPTLFGNFLNSIQYKQWSFSINVTYKLGYYFRKQSINYSQLFSTNAGHSDYANRWIKPGDEAITDIPSLIYPTVSARDNFYNSSEATVVKGDHMRLQFINLGYTINPRKQNTLFKGFQLYINASNLGILWRSNKNQLDPEFPSSVRPTTIYTFGLKTTF